MNNYEICQQFANKHGLVFEKRGEIGFGRPCVGFSHGDKFVDFDPYTRPNYDQVIEDENLICYPPQEVKDAYHKRDCLAVLVHGGNYLEAIRQLTIWVKDMEQAGVETFDYKTGATGVQAILTGHISKAVRKN